MPPAPNHPLPTGMMRPHSRRLLPIWLRPGLAVAIAAVAAPGAAEPTGAAPLSAAPGTAIAVSYADLPPALDLVPYAVVDVPVDTELEVGTNVPQAAVLADGGVILVEESSPTAYLVGRDGSVSSVALDVTPKFIVATPGPVVYGLAAAPDGALRVRRRVADWGPTPARSSLASLSPIQRCISSCPSARSATPRRESSIASASPAPS